MRDFGAGTEFYERQSPRGRRKRVESSESSEAGNPGQLAKFRAESELDHYLAGALLRSDGFHAVYLVVASAFALKVGFVLLILRRQLRLSRFNAPLAMVGVILILWTDAYSMSSFTHDSFLAQVVSELFAIALWWTLLLWNDRPSAITMVLFAVVGSAVFLTGPVWIGPLAIATVLVVTMRRDPAPAIRFAHLGALGPIAIVALVHSIGRTAWVGMVATSGAVRQPSLASLGWFSPPSCRAWCDGGLARSTRNQPRRVVRGPRAPTCRAAPGGT